MIVLVSVGAGVSVGIGVAVAVELAVAVGVAVKVTVTTTVTTCVSTRGVVGGVGNGELIVAQTTSNPAAKMPITAPAMNQISFSTVKKRLRWIGLVGVVLGVKS